MSKRKVKKALWGMQFNGSPLASLYPTYSAIQGSNFGTAPQFGQDQQWFQPGSDFYGSMYNDFQNTKFESGLNLLTSSNSTDAKQYGLQLIQEGMNLSYQSPFFNTSTQTNPNNAYSTNTSGLGGFDLSRGLSSAGLAFSNMPGKTGEVGLKVLKTAGTILKAVSNLQELKGIEGVGKAKGGNIAAIGGAIADLTTGFLPEKTEYSGDKGDITQTMDTVYDSISDAAMSFGPIGMMVGGIMKGGRLLGGVMNSVGGGTDGMTTTDAVLGSAFFNLTPIGLINGFGGKNAETITKNELAFELVGASYTGSGRQVDDALRKSGKKYGTFSQKARREADELILESRRLQDIIEDVARNALNRFAIRNSMAAINGNQRRLKMQGGFDQTAIRAARYGMVIQDLQRAKRIVSSMKYQRGGQMKDLFTTFVSTLPDNLKPTSDGGFNVKRYWELNGKPKNFDEAIKRGMYSQEEDGWHAHTVQYNPEADEYEFMKSSTHPTLQYELDWYNSDDPEATEFRSQYELQKTEPYYKYVRRKGTEQPQTFKLGGSLSNWLIEIDINNVPAEFRDFSLQEVSVDSILPEFREGGKFNIIPEGALHARKHNMEIEGITPKGIPVVSHSEGGEIEQLAEIEREEIIFRLEVTKKLEELAKDGSDEAAIEAGKLLVDEILYNTIDNTNNLI